MFIARPSVAVAMNSAAISKLEPAVRPEGLLIINQPQVRAKVKREDIRVVYVPANHLAAELGSDAAGNLVVLGTLAAACPVVSQSSIFEVLDKMPAKNQRYLEMNKQAFSKGYTLDSQR